MIQLQTLQPLLGATEAKHPHRLATIRTQQQTGGLLEQDPHLRFSRSGNGHPRQHHHGSETRNSSGTEKVSGTHSDELDAPV